MAYKLLEEKHLEELQGIGYIYEHNKTKARVCFIKTEDENKTFSIGFRTPPSDNTGLPHILEHTVLCGSRKYPIKDPFIELAKGSLNTFLNAITYSDKTMYPVASINDKDFHNLVDVYMDAVFFPDIYNNKLTFEQEGWHYELLEQEGEVSYKGVVYNEMKGVFSSPEQILYRKIQQEMFENHPYSYESGGDPMAITDLSYENFLDFHTKYYHPSNSFIFYYGDIDIDKELAYLDSGYLGEFDYKKVDSMIPLVKQYEKEREVEVSYPASEDKNLDNKHYLSYNVLLSESKNILEGIGFDILEYLMIDAPGAVIKEAIIKEGIGEDVFCTYDGSIRQGTFSIIAKNCKLTDKDKFITIINKELEKLSETGFDYKKVQSAISKFEFKTKEADFGQYPKGIIYAIKVMETWLYDENPFVNFNYDEIFIKAKEATKNGLLQSLITKYFINNKHKVLLTLVPDINFNTNKDKIVTNRLKSFSDTLTSEDRIELIKHNKELIAFQEAPETKENLEKLPLLQLSDISRDKKKFLYKTEMIKDTRFLYHKANATNIAYVKASFDVGFIDENQLGILSLLNRMLIKISTGKFHYSELADEINGETGGVHISLAVYEHKSSNKYFIPKLEITGKCFVPKLINLYEIFNEILTNTDFSDVARIRELINEFKSRMQMSIYTSGHSTALLRAQSYISPSASYKEKLRGIEFYEEISLWQNKSDTDLLDLGIMMKKMLSDIISSDRLTIAVTSAEEHKNDVKRTTEQFVYRLPYIDNTSSTAKAELLKPRNEGFKTTSDVQYVAMVGDFSKHGFDYHGSMKVLNTIINLD